MDNESVKRIAEVLIMAQSVGLANQFFLMAIVRDLARREAAPDQYLARLFEAVSARMDQAPVEDEEKPVMVEMRDIIGGFFAKVKHGLDTGGAPKHRPT